MNHLFQKIAYKCIKDMGSFIGFSIICISYIRVIHTTFVAVALLRRILPFFSSPNVS